MKKSFEKRTTYRRYEDRRVAMMLAVHEIIFDRPPPKERDRQILAALADNYQVERAALVNLVENNGKMSGLVAASFGDWKCPDEKIKILGEGFDYLTQLHRTAEGALSFENVRKPEAFTDIAWRSLWSEGIGAPAMALLSMEVDAGGRKLLWLQQVGSTREWSSRDRELIEEVANLLSRAAQKGL